jgi:hypothetical protein
MKNLSLFSVCVSILITVPVLIIPAIAQTVDLMAYDDGTCDLSEYSSRAVSSTTFSY